MKKLAKVMSVVLLVVMSLAVLAACAPNSDPDKAAAALKNNGYTGGKDTTVIPTALRLLNVKDVDCVVSASKVSDDADGNKKGDTVTIVYFTSANAANAAWETMQKYANDKNEDKDSDWVVKKSGAMIYFGTNAGVKAAR